MREYHCSSNTKDVPKPVINDEEFKTISAAFCSYIASGQVNGDPEKKQSDFIWLSFLPDHEHQQLDP
jgi:hypothetical protein